MIHHAANHEEVLFFISSLKNFYLFPFHKAKHALEYEENECRNTFLSVFANLALNMLPESFRKLSLMTSRGQQYNMCCQEECVQHVVFTLPLKSNKAHKSRYIEVN